MTLTNVAVCTLFVISATDIMHQINILMVNSLNETHVGNSLTNKP